MQKNLIPEIDCSSSETHEYSFEVLNRYLHKRHRKVRSFVAPEQLEHVAGVGALMMNNVLTGKQVECLRNATDDLFVAKVADPWKRQTKSHSFAGVYLRNVHAHDARFLSLLEELPFVGTLRSLIGPRICLRSYSVRMSGFSSNEATRWHRDQRSMVKPKPVMFTEPQVLSVLVYLDDANEDTGQFGIVPGSHRWQLEVPEELAFEDIPGSVALSVNAGSACIINAAVIHRAYPHIQTNQPRRTIVMHFAPAYFKVAEYGSLPDILAYQDIIDKAVESKDEETLELYGMGGPM